MKQSLLILLALIAFSCKKEQNNINNQPEKQLTTAEKIARAHGISNWKSVTEINFTFNVDTDKNHYQRSWVWKPKSQDISLITANDTINFNRKNIDSLSKKADSGFINDKYWLLAPFQLVWDEGTTIFDSVNKIAPISKAKLNKLTIIYGDKGGYTPGDAYDFFYDNNYMIKEWIFRESNASKPSMITTFENYENFNGIKIAKDHKKAEGKWNLHFTNILVKTD